MKCNCNNNVKGGGGDFKLNERAIVNYGQIEHINRQIITVPEDFLNDENAELRVLKINHAVFMRLHNIIVNNREPDITTIRENIPTMRDNLEILNNEVKTKLDSLKYMYDRIEYDLDTNQNLREEFRRNCMEYKRIRDRYDTLNRRYKIASKRISDWDKIVNKINALCEIRISNAMRYSMGMNIRHIIDCLTNLQNINIFTGITKLTFCYLDVERDYVVDYELPYTSRWSDKNIIEEFKSYISQKYNNLPYRIELQDVRFSGFWSDPFRSDLYSKDDPNANPW
jgi:hypothetical protein